MERAIMLVLMGWLALNAFAVIIIIGKPRKPLTHGQAVFSLLVSIGMMVGVAYLGGAILQ